MRASYVEDVQAREGEIELLQGDGLHHLLNVARIKEGQSLKLLDGKGKTALGVIKKISKKSIEVEIKKIERHDQGPVGIDIAFAQPKKDALEFCLKAAVETGAREVFLLQSERSQSYPIKEDRCQKIMETALEQSNNPFMPKLNITSLKELSLENYDYCALASLRSKANGRSSEGSGLLLIGPEGGFTQEEEDHIFSYKNSLALQFKGPILRTQTAIPFFMGVLSHADVEA